MSARRVPKLAELARVLHPRRPALDLASRRLASFVVCIRGTFGSPTDSKGGPPWSLAGTGQVLPVNGIDLHVPQAGTGEPLLMIHGVTVDATFEHHEIEQLADTYHVIAPDMRGHGRSTRPAAFTLRDHVEDMIGLLDTLGVQRTAVLGASMGSYIAQALTLAIPDRVSKLILVVAKAHGASSSSARILAEHADELRGMSREEQQQWLNARMFAPQTPAAVRQHVLDWIAARQSLGLGMTAGQLEAANNAVLDFDFR